MLTPGHQAVGQEQLEEEEASGQWHLAVWGPGPSPTAQSPSGGGRGQGRASRGRGWGDTGEALSFLKSLSRVQLFTTPWTVA